MVKKIAVWIIAVIFFAGVTPIFAAGEGKSGPNPNKEAYEHASDRARFKRGEDLKDKDKEAQKAKREVEKAHRKAEKEAKKKQKEAEKKARKMGKDF